MGVQSPVTFSLRFGPKCSYEYDIHCSVLRLLGMAIVCSVKYGRTA